MDFIGVIIGVATFAIIGVMHPVVIKSYYHFGLRSWYAYLIIGIACVAASVFIPNLLVSVIVAVVGISFLWGIRELFEQRERVRKGWHQANPDRPDQVAMQLEHQQLAQKEAEHD